MNDAVDHSKNHKSPSQLNMEGIGVLGQVDVDDGRIKEGRQFEEVVVVICDVAFGL